MKPIRKFIAELARPLALIIDGFQNAFDAIKSWTRTPYFLPGIVILAWLVLAFTAFLPPHYGFNLQTALAVCLIGIGTQFVIIITYKRIETIKYNHERHTEALKDEKDNLVEKVINYREALGERGRVIDTMQVQLERADRRYDELLHARTDEIILEINKRLAKDGEPVRHVFPDVPAAPQPPLGLPDLPRPQPPF